MSNEELKQVVQFALKTENYIKTHIQLDGETEKFDNHMSSVIFATVNCETQNGEKKRVDLVIKKGKTSSVIRELFQTSTVFLQEIILYHTIFPSYRAFQKERGVKKIFNPVPKLFTYSVQENSEYIVLENLKAQGYYLHHRKKPFSRRQTELCLEAYAKLHALSFAMRDQTKSRFEEIMKDLNGDVYINHYNGAPIDLTPALFNQVLELLERKKMPELHKKLNNLLSNGNIAKTCVNFLFEETNYSVLIHGDSWPNNLLFCYQDEEKTIPSNLAIIDWQLTSVRNSPIYDLSFVLYTCASVEDLGNIKELLNVYYDSLSAFIAELGSDPKKLFPYETFLSHWKRYSLFGFIAVPMMMKFLYCQNEDVKSEEATTIDDMAKWVLDAKIDDKRYEDRLIGLCQRFLCDNI